MNVITSTQTLKYFCEALLKEDNKSYITVDTEFQREDTYWPELCLLQIAGSQRHALIDPFAPDIDLSLLKSIFFNPSILKVFHAARQDLEIFYLLWQDLPHPLFDTQIAAMACGFGESIGYSQLVEALLKEKIDKTSQFTNWKHRPLSEKQLRYALEDVTYLRKIYEKLHQQLSQTNRLTWLEEELAILLSPLTYQQDTDKLWMALKPRNKSPRFLAKLKELALARDLLARAQNVPRPRIVKDQALLEMASSPLTCLDDFETLRGLPAGFSKKTIAQEFLAALERAKKLPLEACPKFPPKKEDSKSLEPVVELLRVLLKHISNQHNLAPKMIATPEDLYHIAASEKPHCKAVQGWRYEIFGKEALALKSGEKFISLKNGCIQLETKK